MKRIIFHYLKHWRESSQRKPLILRGARQVGKTHIVRELGHLYKNFVEINFEELSEAKLVFEKNLQPEKIIHALSLLTGKKINPKNTLLFLDEIQEMPRAITALRYFYEKIPELHVIAAGSLVDFAIDSVGVPVGRVTFLYLHPMSFFEFLIATGEILLAQEILEHNIDEQLNEAVHTKLLELLGEYLAVGGLPEVVKQWVETKNISNCVPIQRALITSYKQDFQKYADDHQLKYVDLIFNNIPRLQGKNIKYTQFSTEHRKRELEPCLNLLIKANVTHKVIHSAGNGVPLGAESNPDKFKLIFLDVALAQTMLGLNLKDWFLSPEKELVNKGSLSECFIGQEILAYNHITLPPELYYWQRDARSSQAEVDYLIANSKVIPIEVKGGEGRSLKSLREYLASHPQAPCGIRFSIHNYSKLDNILSYPLYAVAGAIAEDKQALLSLL